MCINCVKKILRNIIVIVKLMFGFYDIDRSVIDILILIEYQADENFCENCIR